MSELTSLQEPSESRPQHVDWLMVILSLSLVSMGLVAIYSSELASGHHTDHLFRQSCAFAIGSALAVGLAVVPYQIFRSYSWVGYGAALLGLTFVLFTGTVFRGTKGWFELGHFRLQASEVARPLFILSFAATLDRRIEWEYFRSLFVPLTLMGLPMGLLLLQPDLSGALVYVPIVVGMLCLAGANFLHLASLSAAMAIMLGVPLASAYVDIAMENGGLSKWQEELASVLSGGWPTGTALGGMSLIVVMFAWFMKNLRIRLPRAFTMCSLMILFLGSAGAWLVQHHIKNYQRERLVTFLNPSADPLGSGYQVRQSRIAIGSGRIFGKGFGETTQVRLGFLPAYHTDFIFSVFAEEFGFAGAFLVMGVYLLMVWRGFEISVEARDRFGSLLAAGVSIMFAFYGFVNIGMTLGLTPVIGVPLPLVSYGGSGLVSDLFAVGILLSVHRHRYIL